MFAEAGTVSSSIELHDFSWNRFPLRVLVDMNKWSTRSYSVAVREALDSWVKSIWNYTHTYTNMTVDFNYVFYASNVNTTGIYDILISFTQNEIAPNVVGLTNLRWDPRLHDPITPIIINITSYSATAEDLFIRNVAMHEFGHALGLGHANSRDTENGPELMYPSSSLQQTVYPSTLNAYGLVMLYSGSYGNTVTLPADIPYMMLAEGSIPQDQTFPKNILSLLVNELDALFYSPEDILYNPMRLLLPIILWIAISLVCGLLLSSGTGAMMVSIAISIFACYVTVVSINLVSLGLKIVSILPFIAIGAYIGGFISNRNTAKKIEHTNMDSAPTPT